MPCVVRTAGETRLMTRSIRRRGALVVALALLLGSLIAATVAGARGTAPTAATVRDGGTLTIGLAEEPDALDPTLARTFVGRMVFLTMCEKLYDLDQHLNLSLIH